MTRVELRLRLWIAKFFWNLSIYTWGLSKICLRLCGLVTRIQINPTIVIKLKEEKEM